MTDPHHTADTPAALPPLTDSLHRLCIAPMMDWTDRHCRYFLRQISRRARLYTEMVTTGALLHGDVPRHLQYDAAEHPLALQLGGSEASALARCARLAEEWGYDEVNLNCGCPSDRVHNGGFGACLMREPQRVAEGIAAMRAATSLPVTVKCRIAVDDEDSVAFLDQFVDTVAAAGCNVFILHARKAWLKGLSPKQNREVPPLDYARVHALAVRRPDLRIVINGGLLTLEDAKAQLQRVDGVMFGRAAYENPWMLATADRDLFGDAAPLPDRRQVLLTMRRYIAEQQRLGTPPIAITRHMLGLFRGEPGARAYRRLLSEGAREPGSTAAIIDTALHAYTASTATQYKERLTA